MSEELNQQPYVVLARKYRPQTFEDLLGQDALVRTLTNAIKNNRLHHAYILTGIRGVGKTTTARLIARALNCTGLDGQGAPTIHPCGVCENCQAIAAGRHIDILELDAASRTGVDDIRELLDGVCYKPTNARYKIYIIDEVHMLSKGAFNALLKTLEEPPAHVKFIFATTEIRKVPVTILSRCQRFDLQRLNIETLLKLFQKITAAENIEAEHEALDIIARAADGSARDGLSMLDQAIVLGNGKIKTDTVVEMIGLADRTQTLDLFDKLISGDMQGVLINLRSQYKNGANPLVILQDLIDVTHMLAKAKIVPGSANTETLGENERELCQKLASTLSIAVLSRMWQMMIKGINELNTAPIPLDALEMILIRVAYSASLPTPSELLNEVKKKSDSAPVHQSGAASEIISRPQPHPSTPKDVCLNQPVKATAASNATQTVMSAAENTPVSLVENLPSNLSAPTADDNRAAELSDTNQPANQLDEFLAYLQENKKMLLLYSLKNDVSIEEFGNGHLKLTLSDKIQPDFMANLHKALEEATGQKWLIDIKRGIVGDSIASRERAVLEEDKRNISEYPLVKTILSEFKGARIDTLTRKTDLTMMNRSEQNDDDIPTLTLDEEE